MAQGPLSAALQPGQLEPEAQKMAENEIFAVYFAQLQEKYGVNINQNVLDKMYTQNAEQQF